MAEWVKNTSSTVLRAWCYTLNIFRLSFMMLIPIIYIIVTQDGLGNNTYKMRFTSIILIAVIFIFGLSKLLKAIKRLPNNVFRNALESILIAVPVLLMFYASKVLLNNVEYTNTLISYYCGSFIIGCVFHTFYKLFANELDIRHQQKILRIR